MLNMNESKKYFLVFDINLYQWISKTSRESLQATEVNIDEGPCNLVFFSE